MASSPQLSVSIVVYNSSLELLRKTLSSLERAALGLDSGPVQVTLVDNASDPAYREALALLINDFAGMPGINLYLHQSPGNRGYGGGHNLALSDMGKYHLVLNPDVELEPGALQAGLSRLESEAEIALVSPYASGPGGEQEYLCKRYPSVWVLLLRAFAPGLGSRLCPEQLAQYQMSDVCGEEQEVDVTLASGCFMLTRGDALREVAGFDERYFMYFEDFDLSLRLAKFGRLLYLPSMRIIHHGGYAGSKGLRHIRLFVSGGLRFFRQHGWRWF